MNVLDEARKRPVMSGITLVGAAGAILLFMNVMPGLEMIVSIKKAPEVAQAALQKANEADVKATESRKWIDEYIADQKSQREFDQKLAEQAAEYQRQMLELQRQQQQAPNQSFHPPARTVTPQEWQDEQGRWWCCTQGCDADDNWWRCE